MTSRNFLLEIGVEEIPAGYLQDAVNWLEKSFRDFVANNRLAVGEVRTTFTPRRLTIKAQGLQEQQEDLEQVKTGPSSKIAFESCGKLTNAGMGFLRSSKASEDDVFTVTTEKGEFIAVKISQKGQPASVLLTDWVSNLGSSMPFPKRMKWGTGCNDFARPVRWLVCLWSNEVLPVQMCGVQADRVSFGNRYLGLTASVEISNPSLYEEQLKTVAVWADRQQRYNEIKRQLLDCFPQGDYQVDINEGLLQTVTDLIEHPTAVVAEYDSKFLMLPELIITSTISTNQKYFSVKDATGKLSNKFVFISNGNPEHSDIIRKGNEKVVSPRLEDAVWYYQEDTKKPMASYLEGLKEVVFQAKLGTVYDKSRRIAELSAFVGRELQLSDTDQSNVIRTAELCKADLVTLMLGEKEFTKLQGYIGKYYALASGENEAVAQGIYEHYMPKGQNDALPSSLTGAIVAVADKLDTVCGIIGAGMLPTGSADPFALRRAANGVVQIIAERGWDINLINLIDYSIALYEDRIDNKPDTQEKVGKFFHQRAVWLLQQQGIEYDVTDSVMHIDFGNLIQLIERAKAVQAFKLEEDFIRLVIGFKRVANILKDTKHEYSFNPQLCTEQEEIALHECLMQQQKKIDMLLKDRAYTSVLEQLVAIRPAIDAFFDKVLVNAEDKALRENRQALLQEVRTIFLSVADLSLLVVEGDKK